MRDAFLKVLAENEDDVTTRLIYADWLDEYGEHEEADRQRKWPAAKEWLVRFCQANNEEDLGELDISYADLIALGRQAVESADDDRIGFSCGSNTTMKVGLELNSQEFWKNWSIITGISLPPDIEEKSYFWCSC